jgi:hypothetical protein
MQYKIEIDFSRNCQCGEYHYTVYAYNTKTASGWYNTGICGICATPELCFTEGLKNFRESDLVTN